MNSERKASLQNIRHAIAILFNVGQVVEVRVPGKFGCRSGYFDDFEKMAVVIQEESGRSESVYYTLNSCHDALLARREPNVLQDVKSAT